MMVLTGYGDGIGWHYAYNGSIDDWCYDSAGPHPSYINHKTWRWSNHCYHLDINLFSEIELYAQYDLLYGT